MPAEDTAEGPREWPVQEIARSLEGGGAGRTNQAQVLREHLEALHAEQQRLGRRCLEEQ